MRIFTLAFLLLALNSKSQINQDSLSDKWLMCLDSINKGAGNGGQIAWTTYVCGSTQDISNIIRKTESVSDSLNVTPNPFQKCTVAYYSFSQNDTVSLDVYNRFGQLILPLLTNSVMPSGNYQDSVIMDSFADDTYIVSLKLGNRKHLGKQISKNSALGINEIQIKNEIQIYPNPSSSILHIENAEEHFGNSQIQITNTLGQTVLRLPFSNTLDVSALCQGVYTIRIIARQNLVFYSKFIKD